MNNIYSSALTGLIALLLVAACNDAPPPKNGGSPSGTPAADAPSLKGSDVKGPDVGGPAARAPSVNAGDIKAPQTNGPTINAHIDTNDKPDAGMKK